MEQINPAKNPTTITEVVGHVKIVESDLEVLRPVFKDVDIDRPVFKDKQIDVPVGFDKIVNLLASEISEKIIRNVLAKLDERLENAISTRVTSITYPKMIEELMVTKKDVTVDNPVYKDVVVERPVFVDKEVINPVRKDVEVINAVIIDKPVFNAVVEDVRVTNAIVKDVEVERAVIREKTIDVIHKNCFSADGKPLL